MPYLPKCPEGDMSVITTIYGPNSYLREAKLASIVGGYLPEEITKLDAQKIEPAELMELLKARSLFVSKRLVVISDLTKNNLLVQQFEELFRSLSEDVSVVLLEHNIDKRTKLYRLLKNHTEMKECGQLSRDDLVAWLITQAKKYDGNLDRDSAYYLVERVGSNQLQLNSELEKLIIFDPIVTKSTINQMVERTPQESIFALIDITSKGDSRKALSSYRELRRANSDPYYVMSMIIWQLHNMLVIKAAGSRNSQAIATETGMSPYVVQKTAALVSTIDLKDIKQMIKVATKADMRLKRTSTDTDSVIEQLLLEITKIARRD